MRDWGSQPVRKGSASRPKQNPSWRVAVDRLINEFNSKGAVDAKCKCRKRCREAWRQLWVKQSAVKHGRVGITFTKHADCIQQNTSIILRKLRMWHVTDAHSAVSCCPQFIQRTCTRHTTHTPKRTRTQSRTDTIRQKRIKQVLFSLSTREICGLAASLHKSNGTVRRIAMLVPFPGRLASETRPGFQKTVVREKWPTRQSCEQCCGPIARHPPLLLLLPCVRKLNVMKTPVMVVCPERTGATCHCGDYNY